MRYDQPFGPLAMGILVGLGFMLLAFRECGHALGM